MNRLKKAGLIMGILALLSGCTGKGSTAVSGNNAVEGSELFAVCKTEAEALDTAQSYGIELVRWGDGIAVFHTEDDPEAVIQYGKDHGLPLLEINRSVRKLD